MVVGTYLASDPVRKASITLLWSTGFLTYSACRLRGGSDMTEMNITHVHRRPHGEYIGWSSIGIQRPCRARRLIRRVHHSGGSAGLHFGYA